MNMRDLCREYEDMRHEYIGGCILGETLLSIFFRIDLAYIIFAYMRSRHCTAAAVL